MSKFKSYHEYTSRLARQETKRYTQQSFFFILATLALIVLVIFVGIPLVTKAAIFIGDIRSSNTPITNQETLRPATPQLIPPPVATNSSNLTVSGYAQAGAKVAIFINGVKQAESLVDESGSFNFNDLKLNVGANEIYAISFNSNDQASPESSPLTINVFDQKPKLTLTNPENGAKIYGFQNQQLNVEGLTDTHNTVYINDRQTFVTTNGTFKQSFILKDGENSFTITATDPAGNQTSQNLVINYYP